MLSEEGQILTGPQFSKPVRVETVRSDVPGSWVLGVIGTKTERFRRVTLTEADLAQIAIQSATLAFDGDPNFLRLGPQACRTATNPISAPRCLGSAAMMRSVSAAEVNRMP
jgi:hypothetical protein